MNDDDAEILKLIHNYKTTVLRTVLIANNSKVKKHYQLMKVIEIPQHPQRCHFLCNHSLRLSLQRAMSVDLPQKKVKN